MDASWLAVYNPSPRVVLREVAQVTHGLLAAVFWRNPLRPAHRVAFEAASLSGLATGLGRGLAVGALPLAFVLAYLVHGLPPILAHGTPALWAGAQLGAAVGLVLALPSDWNAMRRNGRDAGGLTALAAAAVPAALLRFWLHHLTGQLESAATVGLLLVGTGGLLASARRAGPRAADGAPPAMPPWLAGLGGVAAGAAALPGISMVGVFWAAALAGRLPRAEALRFALMAAAPAAAIGGLLWLPAAAAHGAAAILPAALGACVGAWGGGRLLTHWLRRDDGSGWIGLCSTLGAVLVLLGVFAS